MITTGKLAKMIEVKSFNSIVDFACKVAREDDMDDGHDVILRQVSSNIYIFYSSIYDRQDQFNSLNNS